MSTPFLVIVGILAIALVVVLGMGIIGLAKGGGNPRRSNKLMQARVAIQLAIILVLLVAALVAGK